MQEFKGLAIGGELEGRTIKHDMPVYRHLVKTRMSCVYESPDVPLSELPFYTEDYHFRRIEFGDKVYNLWVHDSIKPQDIFSHMLKQLTAWSRLIQSGRISAWDIHEDVLRRTT